MLVATVLTVYGIETEIMENLSTLNLVLQQYLPFTVLKLKNISQKHFLTPVATVLTVYGIETNFTTFFGIGFCVATVLTVYGIETMEGLTIKVVSFVEVATVLTVYGIETFHF